ncbi:hypothetical protein HanIR_Chr04g0196961 [Helianthus annuus]|nr:hypothetical protein HanIR_Chr04g0196961 [Helianthus annuus]
MIATFLCLTGLLTTCWIYSGHFPLSDLYESLIFLSWSFSLIHIVPYFKIRKNDLTTITASITIFTQGFATSGPSPCKNRLYPNKQMLGVNLNSLLNLIKPLGVQPNIANHPTQLVILD